MDCSLPGSSVHGVARVGHDLATKPPPSLLIAPQIRFCLSRPPGQGEQASARKG